MRRRGNAGLDAVADELLTLAEAREAGLMSWGFYAPTIDVATELRDFLEDLPESAAHRWEAAQAEGTTVEDLVENLLGRTLLVRTEEGHRTRFAEGVRLLAGLRQLFDKTRWHESPRLVADLKADVRRRSYPARDVAGEDLLRSLRDDRVPSAWVDGVRHLLRTEREALMTVAGFQRRATEEILRRLRGTRDTGMVIGAGTGSGKTKAFYTPALAWLAAGVTNQRHVAAVAIYPRTELLRDQFREAYAEVRRLEALQRGRGKRGLTLGAFYGDTKRSARALKDELDKPARGGRAWGSPPDWTCPFLSCSTPDCRGVQLVWRYADVERAAAAEQAGQGGAHERLECPSCGATVEAGTVLLTRDHMAERPPDLLFTTTESLNRRMASGADLDLFGVGGETPPRLLLLDEIHAYEGLTGAQTAYLLRRWRHGRRRRSEAGLCVVGLSATLADAEAFFGRLTGLDRRRIAYIAPTSEELVDEGADYNLAVKGNPVNQTALLSTSVQTAMLVGRILDPPEPGIPGHESPSRGALGRRTFAFTDQLDVVNRWFHIEQDAEGGQRLARLRATNPEDRRPPAAQRRSTAAAAGPPVYSEADETARHLDGQLWGVAEEIGHDLTRGLSVGLVSSQSQLLGQPKDLVIATASLEVGFNDEEVGAILQHKAPKSMASFLQRKGRAGRRRGMRPWMVVVASSYGRDRLAFQHAEELFQPSLRSIELPTENVYVQKIQATYALMDWLAWEVRRQDRVDVNLWNMLRDGGNYGSFKLEAVRRVVDAVLDGSRRADLERHLAHALELGPEDVEQVIWGEPRSLMLEVLPSISRQLATSWAALAYDPAAQKLVSSSKEAAGKGPLPDFVPENLFSDLNLPELLLTFRQGVHETETVSLLQGMREFAPGRVSKRYAIQRDQTSAHWLCPPDAATVGGAASGGAAGSAPPVAGETVDTQLAALVGLDATPRVVDLEGEAVHVYRPIEYVLEQVPDGVLPTSSATLRWRSALRAVARPGFTAGGGGAPGTAMALPADSPWATLVTGISAYEHRHSGAVEVVRAATGVVVETRRRSGGTRRRYRFVAGEDAAALGFTVTADGIAVDVRPLDAATLLASPAWPELRRALAPECFRDALRAHPRLAPVDPSSFEVDWLWQLEMAMLTAAAVATGVTLAEAADHVDERRAGYCRRTLEAMFQAQPLAPNAENDLDNVDAASNPEEEGRLQKRLRELEDDDDVVAALRATRSILWSDDDPFLRPWLERCYDSSIGAAVFAAVLRLVPEIDPESLSLDVQRGRVWITEETGGGVGHVVKLGRAIRSRPRALGLLLDDVTRHCDRAAISASLEEVVAILAQPGSALGETMAVVREQGTLRRQEAARRELVEALERAGVQATRELLVNLSAKVLRAHSGPESDALVAALVARWRAEERRLGCAIDLRAFVVAAMRIEDLAARVRTMLAAIGGTTEEAQLYNVLQSMLWLSCPTSCDDCIARWSPFGDRPTASRALLRSQLPPERPPVRLGDPLWRAELHERLATSFAGTVAAPHGALAELADALAEALVTPVETEFQLFYPVVERVAREGHDWLATLVVRELSQG